MRHLRVQCCEGLDSPLESSSTPCTSQGYFLTWHQLIRDLVLCELGIASGSSGWDCRNRYLKPHLLPFLLILGGGIPSKSMSNNVK